MSLRELAEADLAVTLEDAVYGFGFPITVKNPAGLESSELVGASNDIAELIDPDTGQAVSGRSASVVLRISSLVAAGFTELPRAIADASSKPWLITFLDLAGNSQIFKVKQSMPDRTLGTVLCYLEAYKP